MIIFWETKHGGWGKENNDYGGFGGGRCVEIYREIEFVGRILINGLGLIRLLREIICFCWGQWWQILLDGMRKRKQKTKTCMLSETSVGGVPICTTSFILAHWSISCSSPYRHWFAYKPPLPGQFCSGLGSHFLTYGSRW